MFDKVDSIIIPNYHYYWINPIINKYFNGKINFIEGTLILRKNKKEVFISHPFYFKEVKKEFGKKYIIENYNDGEEYNKLLKKYNGKKIGFNGKYNSYNMLKCMKKSLKGKKVTWVDVSKELDESRTIKTKEEIVKIKKAVTEIKKVLKNIQKKLKINITEKEVEILFRTEFEKDGFDLAFCIVAFNKNTLNLHHKSGKTKLKEGPVLIDVGAKYQGYCADISESFWFGKKETKSKKEYDKELKFVKNKLLIIQNQLKPNIKANSLFKLCDGLKMPHALGHGLGLEEHDLPGGIGPKNKWMLKEGMVLAIEPGHYDKFGIRFERDYLITKTGFKEL